MPKVQPPELRKFMDKKLSSECGGGGSGSRAARPASARGRRRSPHRQTAAPGFAGPGARRCCSGGGSRRRGRRCSSRRGPRPLTSPPPPAPAAPRPPAVALNANRHVTGTLRGFDQFMNLVLDNTVDTKAKQDIGMVVIRGNSIITIEALEPIF